MDRVSALMDGELDEHQARQLITGIRQQGELRERWDTFHLIGDTLRGDGGLSADFSERLARRLAQEPTILAPRRYTAKRMTTYALSAAASLSAVALVAWTALSSNSPVAPQPQVAQVQPAQSAIVATPAVLPVSIPSEGNMNEYLLAHQGFSPSTAIQGAIPYIRSVSARQSAQAR
jgi:sigma-E factor negative regulatory protein RseA